MVDDWYYLNIQTTPDTDNEVTIIEPTVESDESIAEHDLSATEPDQSATEPDLSIIEEHIENKEIPMKLVFRKRKGKLRRIKVLVPQTKVKPPRKLQGKIVKKSDKVKETNDEPVDNDTITNNECSENGSGQSTTISQEGKFAYCLLLFTLLAVIESFSFKIYRGIRIVKFCMLNFNSKLYSSKVIFLRSKMKCGADPEAPSDGGEVIGL